MKHSYRLECTCRRCQRERARRMAQADHPTTRARRPSETAMERWARDYDRLNGAPEDEEDR